MSVIVGEGKFKFQIVEGWDKLPKEYEYARVCGIAVDDEDRVHVANRSEHPVYVFDRNGKFLGSWGEGIFDVIHFIKKAPDGSLFCTDVVSQSVRKFTKEGKLLATIGPDNRVEKSHIPTVYTETLMKWREIKRSGPPFCGPTDMAFAPTGEIYVTDGYGNARVHKYSADGKLILSWGEPGTEPGLFRIPHSVCVDKTGTVYVADRENSRIQLFTPDGEFINQWFGTTRPAGLCFDAQENLYVAETGYRYARSPLWSPPLANSPPPCISIWTLKEKMLARFGCCEDPRLPGHFVGPHEICVDSHGDLYVADMVSMGIAMGGVLKASECHPVQKYLRIK